MYFFLTILLLVFMLSSSRLEPEPVHHDTTLLVTSLSPAEGNTREMRTRFLNVTLETKFGILIWTRQIITEFLFACFFNQDDWKEG